MLGTLTALARSTHPGPALAVTVVAVVLGVGAGLEPWRVAVLGVAMLADQVSVGLSNDWLDAGRDRANGRTDKPVARGDVGIPVARAAALFTAVLAVALTVPLGWPATIAHTVALASAWSYNAGLKNSPVSVLPFALSFGMLPLIATLALPDPALAAPWALGAGALLGVAAHFANVLPDLADDDATGIRGLPHRLGARASGVVIAVALAVASALVVFGPAVRGGDSPGVAQLAGFAVSVILAAECARRAITRPPTRRLFQLIIAAALLNVVLLALAGQALLA